MKKIKMLKTVGMWKKNKEYITNESRAGHFIRSRSAELIQNMGKFRNQESPYKLLFNEKKMVESLNDLRTIIKYRPVSREMEKKMIKELTDLIRMLGGC